MPSFSSTMRPESMNQYQDLPQIPSNSMMDEPTYNYWPHEQVASVCTYPHRSANVYRGDYLTGDFVENKPTGISMQRYLHGPDPYPNPLLHAKLDARMPLQSQHPTHFDPPFPAAEPFLYPRNGSPDRTSSGGSSYVPPNELRSPHPFSQVSYRSTSEYIDPGLSYPSPQENSYDGGYPSELSLQGGTICPRDTEHYHHEETENAIEEHELIDEKPGIQHGHYTQEETVPEAYKGYNRSVGNSMRDAEEVQPMTPSAGSPQPTTPPAEESDSDYSPRKGNKRRSSYSSQGSGKANQKRRNRKSSTTQSSSRVNKKPRGPNASPNTPKGASGPTTSRSDIDRPFICLLAAYGCQSSFTSKNEWKRHIATQHIKRGFWRCDLCPKEVDGRDEGTTYHNDFNRKDLFTQHLRRMHAAPANSRSHKEEYVVNEDNITEHQQRCYQLIRGSPPQSACLFCDLTFRGPQSWDERMEHVGKHFEKDRKATQIHAQNWKEDGELEQWFHDEGLITPDRNGGWKIGDGKPNRDSAMHSDDDDDA